MKKIVPFTKNLMFKTKIGEITAISLDNTLKLDGQYVRGKFIIVGDYKILVDSEFKEEFSFEIPVDITIDDKYETKNCVISIDEFSYEIINEETLKVNISVMLDDLDIKEEIIEPITMELNEAENDIIELRENLDVDVKEDENLKTEVKDEVKENILQEKNFEKEYSVYRVYTFKEDDTIDIVLEKYKINREILADYNDLDNISVGTKLIIPSVDE